jgi:hypothetical protein
MVLVLEKKRTSQGICQCVVPGKYELDEICFYKNLGGARDRKCAIKGASQGSENIAEMGVAMVIRGTTSCNVVDTQFARVSASSAIHEWVLSM